MEEKNFQISFIEKDLSEQKKLMVHIPHAKRLPEDHPYFEKQTLWTLTKKANNNSIADKIIEDELNGIRYQEIPVNLIDVIIGIHVEVIKSHLNSKNCFSFDYNPSESDNLILRLEYIYQEIKALPRPFSRAIEVISLTFHKYQWQIDSFYQPGITQNQREGIVEITGIDNFPKNHVLP